MFHVIEELPSTIRSARSRRCAWEYVYYRCTGHKGACGNSYVREEQLADLLGDVIRPIQITSEIAEDIATGLRGIDHQAEERRRESLRKLDQRRRTVVSKLDRGYDDFVSGRISEEFWTGKSKDWESELATVDADRPRLEQPRPLATTTAAKILELAKRAEFLYKNTKSDRTAPIARSGAIELHDGSRKSLPYLQ